MNTKEIMGIHEAAEFLGRKHQALRRLIARGQLRAITIGQAYMFDRKDLEALKQKAFPQGMTHGDIARVYQVARPTAAYHFKRLGVQPIGYTGGKNRAAVYDESTVAKFAALLGWVDRRKNPTNEP